MFRELKWSESLRTHESSVVNEFHKAKSYGEQRQLAEKLSFERDRNQSPAILQNLYVGEKVHKTYQQLLEEYQEKMEKLRSKYGATDVSIANLSPFTLNAFQDDDEEENGAVSLNSLFNSAGYKYSKRLTNSYDKAKLRRLRTVPTKAYINHHLWSARAINIEEQLRQLSIPNDICVDKLLFTYDRIQTGLAYGFVDTFWPTHGENSVKRDCIGRLSIYTETMLKFNPSLAKENYRELELDALVLTLVNDFLHLQKQLRHLQAHPHHRLPPAPRMDQKEGDCKVEALMIAIGTDKLVHMRPLCTSADLSLAMYELLDSRQFSNGVIQMPYLLPMQYERHTEGFYRFNFTMPYASSTWQYIKYNLPHNSRDIRTYLSGIYCDINRAVNNHYFLIEELDATALPVQLQSAALCISQALTHVWNAGEVISSATIDIEACRESVEIRKRDAVYVLPPHLASKEDCERYVYRMRNVLNIRTQKRIAVGRRNAISTLDGNSMRSLKDFYVYYHHELTVLLGKIGRPVEDSNMPDMQIFARNRARQHFAELVDNESDDSSEDEGGLGGKFGYVNTNVSLNRNASIDLSSMSSMSKEFALALENAKKAVVSMPEKESKMQENLSDGEDSQNEEDGREAHRDSIVLLDKHRATISREFVRSAKRARQEKDLAEKAERAEKAAAEKSLSAQSSSSSLAPTYSYSSLHSSQTTQRASNVGIRGRKFPHVVETNYEELMEKATKAHLESIAAAETQLPKLCPENHTLPYFNSRKAAVKLLQFRHKDVLSSGPHSEEAPDSAPPTYMQHIVEESERYFDPSLAVPETFFRDFTLEQKVRRLAYSTEIDQFFGQLNVQEALAEVSTDGEEGNDGRDGSLSGRSLQYFLEHEEENKRAFELLLQGMNSRIVNGVREYERFQRIKQYVHKRRNLQQLTLRQVQDLHIINHFQKPHEYSDSEEEEVKETEEDTLNLSNLLGDYADQSNLQTLIDERAKEEEKANKPKLNVRPKTSQVNPDLYRRLSARVSMHRNSVSEGGERHNISSIRKGRSTMYISLNNVLLDGKVIKEIAQTKDDDGHKNTDLNWEAMTDSLSTVLSTSNLTAESTVQVLPIVLEEDSPGGGSPAGRRTPGGRFWTPSRDSVIERHIEAEFMCVRAPQSQFREAEQAKAFEDELETKHDSAERSEIEHRENNVVVYAGDDQQPFFDETEIVGTKHVISAEDSADVRRHLYFNDDTIDAKGLCVVQPSTSVRSRERRHANIDIRTSRPASTTKTASKPSSPGQLVETKSETVEFVQRISSVNREHSVLPQPIDVCDDPHVVPTTHCDSHSPEHTINKTNPESFSTSRESTPLAHKQVCFVPAPQGDQSLYAGTLTNSLRATTPLIQVQVRVPSPLAERQTDAAHEILQKEWPQEEDMPCDDELLSLLQEVSVSREAEKDPLLSKSDSVNKLYKKKVVHNIDLPFRSNKQRNKYVYTNNRQYKTKPTPPTTPTPASSTPSRPVRFGVKGLRCDFSVPKCGDNQDEDNSDMHSSKSHSTSDLPTIHTRHHVHTSPPHHAHHANPQPSSILSKIFHQYRIDPSTNILLTSSLPTPHSYPASDFSGIQHVIDRSVEIEGGLEIEIGEGLTGSSLGGESTMSACVPNLVFTPRDLSLRSEELNLWMQGMDSLEGVGYSNFGGVDEIVIDSGGSKEAVIAERIELDVTSTMPRPSIDTEDNQGSNDAAIKQPGESIVEGNLDSAAHGDDSINPLPSLTLNSSVVSANSGQEETEFTPNHPTSTLTLPATQTLQSNPPSSFRKSSRLLQSPNRKNRVLKGWASGVVEGGSEMGSPLPPQSLLISDDPRTLLVEGVEGRVYYSSDGSESIFNPFREGKSGRGEVKMNKTTVQLSPHVTAPPALSPPVSNEIFRNSTKRKKSAMQSTARKEDIQYDDEVEDDKDNSKRKFGLLLGVGGGTFTLPTVL